MTKEQAKKRFGKEGTYKLRKQWQVAVSRGKKIALESVMRIPNTNQMYVESKANVILSKTLAKIYRMNPR